MSFNILSMEEITVSTTKLLGLFEERVNCDNILKRQSNGHPGNRRINSRLSFRVRTAGFRGSL